MDKIKVGILQETKTPPDRRVAIPPKQAVDLLKKFPNVELFIQPSELRAYTDKEYTDLGLTLSDDLTHCDILIGVKEVDMPSLLPNKTYLFFSHTAKRQAYNRPLLQLVLEKNIRLIDYEYLTNQDNMRLVAFGRWAGIVGAYNSLIAYGQRFGTYDMKRANACHDMDEFFDELAKVKLGKSKVLISGGGRVAHGAEEVLEKIGIPKVSPQNFLKKEFDHAVYTQIDPWHYMKRKDKDVFDLEHFFKHPYEYESNFLPYTKVSDMYIACHFWDQRSPRFFTAKDMQSSDFRIKVVGDVSCDIDGPIPSTIKASTIKDPFYGYNALTQKETDPFSENNITVMAVDNLPGEAPRNASIDFGNDLIDTVFPSLFGEDSEGIIERATITKDGKLTPNFVYLQDFAEGKD